MKVYYCLVTDELYLVSLYDDIGYYVYRYKDGIFASTAHPAKDSFMTYIGDYYSGDLYEQD